MPRITRRQIKNCKGINVTLPTVELFPTFCSGQNPGFLKGGGGVGPHTVSIESEGTHQFLIAFSKPVVGSLLLKEVYQKRWSQAPQDSPWLLLCLMKFSIEHRTMTSHNGQRLSMARKRKLNSNLPFTRAALKFWLPWESLSSPFWYLSWQTICLGSFRSSGMREWKVSWPAQKPTGSPALHLANS